MKRLKHFSVTIAMIISVFCLLYSPIPARTSRAGDLGTIQAIMNWYLSSNGVFRYDNKNKKVSSLPESALSALRSYIDSKLEDESITVDADGNYKFSDGVFDGMYDAIMSDDSYMARTVSDFSNFDPLYTHAAANLKWETYHKLAWETRAWKVNTTMPFPDMGNYSATYKSDFENALKKAADGWKWPEQYMINVQERAGNNIWFVIYDVSEVAYLRFSNKTDDFASNRGIVYRYWFYNAENKEIAIPRLVIECSGMNVNISYSKQSGFAYTGGQGLDNPGQGTSYYSFPGQYFTANVALICAMDSGSYNTYNYNLKYGTVTISTYSPNNISNTVNQNTINNNDWGDIYNQQVRIINNNITEEMDDAAIRKLIKQKTDAIKNAVDSGFTNIAEIISIQNDYLDQINGKLSTIEWQLAVIYNYLEEHSTGAGGSDGSTALDLEELYAKLDALHEDTLDTISNLDNIYTQQICDKLDAVELQLETMFRSLIGSGTNARLAQIELQLDGISDDFDLLLEKVDYIATLIPSDGISTGTPVYDYDPDTDTTFDFHFTPEMTFGDKAKALGTGISSKAVDVAPLVYLFAIGNLVTALSAEPVPPKYDLEVAFHNPVNPSEESKLGGTLSLDMSEYEYAHKVLIAIECIIFILVLMFLTFKLIKWFVSVF